MKREFGENTVCHNLTRSNLINANQHRLLCIVASFSKACFLKVPEMALIMGLEERQFRRVLNSLTFCGLIGKKYIRYKKIMLWVCTIETQNYWLAEIADTKIHWSTWQESDTQETTKISQLSEAEKLSTELSTFDL